jgi:hypothetical protein
MGHSARPVVHGAPSGGGAMTERGSAGREGRIQLHWRRGEQALVWMEYWRNLVRAVKEWCTSKEPSSG